MTPIDLFVIGTSTLLSALILPGSTPDRAFRKADEAGRLAFSEETLSELKSVITRPKFDRYVSFSGRLAFLEKLVATGVQVPITHTVTACRDPKDNKFLELALSASAAAIISGDDDLLVLHPFEDIAIFSPAAYLAS